MAAPPFSLPPRAPHSPHVSTAAWPNLIAIAIAAIGQVTLITLSGPRPPYIAYIDREIAHLVAWLLDIDMSIAG